MYNTISRYLASFKFGDFPQTRQFAKLKTSQKFPAIRYVQNNKASSSLSSILSPGHEKRIVGEGVPLVEDPVKRGDLIVRFQVKFPATLDTRQKEFIKQALVGVE